MSLTLLQPPLTPSSYSLVFPLKHAVTSAEIRAELRISWGLSFIAIKSIFIISFYHWFCWSLTRRCGDRTGWRQWSLHNRSGLIKVPAMSCGEAQEGSREEINLGWMDFVTDLGGLSKRAKKKNPKKFMLEKLCSPSLQITLVLCAVP